MRTLTLILALVLTACTDGVGDGAEPYDCSDDLTERAYWPPGPWPGECELCDAEGCEPWECVSVVGTPDEDGVYADCVPGATITLYR